MAEANNAVLVMEYLDEKDNSEGAMPKTRGGFAAYLNDPATDVEVEDVKAVDTLNRAQDLAATVAAYCIDKGRAFDDNLYKDLVRFLHPFAKELKSVMADRGRDRVDREESEDDETPLSQMGSSYGAGSRIEIDLSSKEPSPVKSPKATDEFVATDKEKEILEAHNLLICALSELKVVSLVAAIMTGSLPKTCDARGMIGFDFRMSEHARKMAKAKIMGLLHAKTMAEMGDAIQNAMALLAAADMADMAIILSGWWQETTAALGMDYKAVMAYATAYFTRSYVGVGIPKKSDPILIVRFKGGDSNDMAKKLEDAEASVKTMGEVMRLMRAETKELKKSVERIQKTRSRTAAAEKERNAKGKGAVQCFNCKGNHLVKDCPELQANDDAGNESE